MVKRAVFLIFLIFTAIPAFSTTYYTAKLCTGGSAPPNCTDANNGTSRATAELTIAAGIAHLSAGDTLIVGAGTYAEVILNPPTGTSDVAHTIVQAAPGEVVILNGTGADADHRYVLMIENKNYITIDGFVFRGTSTVGLGVVTIGDLVNGTGGAGSTYIVLQNSEVDGVGIAEYCVGGHNAGTTPKGSHISLLNLLIHGCGNTTPTYDTFDGHGVYPSWHDSIADGITIYNIGNSTDGGDAYHSYNSNNGGLDNNIIRNSLFYSNYGAGIRAGDGNANQVYNNVLYDNNLKVEGGAALNVAAPTTGTVVYNNTVVDNNDTGVNVSASAASTNVRNNIAYLNDTANYANAGTGTTHTSNLEGTDPSFVNATTRNYHLSSGSVAIDAGADLSAVFTTDRDGVSRTVPYDQGAYAYTANVVPPACSFDVCETFDNYPLTTDLNGLNSGTGWTGAWTKAVGSAITIQTAPAGGEGGMAVNSTASSTYTRTFTAATAGTFRVLMRWSTPTLTANAKMNFILSESTSSSAAVIISIATDGNIVAYDGTGMTDVTLLAFSGTDTAKNVWSTVDIEFDDAAQPDKFRARVNLGAWSAWLGTLVAYTNLDKAWIEDNATNTHDFWADAIGGSPAGTTAVPYNAFTSTRIR